MNFIPSILIQSQNIFQQCAKRNMEMQGSSKHGGAITSHVFAWMLNAYHCIIFFHILNAKIYNNILPITLPTKLLYDTTKTLPGGAICHDYPLAFNINLKKEKKIHLNIPLNTKC